MQALVRRLMHVLITSYVSSVLTSFATVERSCSSCWLRLCNPGVCTCRSSSKQVSNEAWGAA